MPDLLLTEAGDRLLQESGSPIVLEYRARGTLTVPRVTSGASVEPIRFAGALVSPSITRAPLVTPDTGIGP